MAERLPVQSTDNQLQQARTQHTFGNQLALAGARARARPSPLGRWGTGPQVSAGGRHLNGASRGGQSSTGEVGKPHRRGQTQLDNQSSKGRLSAARGSEGGAPAARQGRPRGTGGCGAAGSSHTKEDWSARLSEVESRAAHGTAAARGPPGGREKEPPNLGRTGRGPPRQPEPASKLGEEINGLPNLSAIKTLQTGEAPGGEPKATRPRERRIWNRGFARLTQKHANGDSALLAGTPN